ncbi:MAG: Stp1/IreP family PP2C-type Ser/Thr phosphatase [Candidatus Angelobacter sp.]
MTFAIEVAGQTDVGCVRTNNEDNFGYDARCGIFVVCDGMGGQAAGEVASKMAVDALLEYFRDPANMPSLSNGRLITSGGEAKSLAAAINLANHAIHAAGNGQLGRSGMGSTIVAALVRGHSLAIAHVGDSRIYLVRHGAIQQLTQDHSLVMEQVRLGYITREQAERSELQNVILRALGPEADVEADVEDRMALPGDLLLMTSDGLTRHVTEDEILNIVTASGSLEQACAALVRAAKDRGGDDNITCLLLRIVERPWYKNLLGKVFSGGQQWQNSI